MQKSNYFSRKSAFSVKKIYLTQTGKRIDLRHRSRRKNSHVLSSHVRGNWRGLNNRTRALHIFQPMSTADSRPFWHLNADSLEVKRNTEVLEGGLDFPTSIRGEDTVFQKQNTYNRLIYRHKHI